MIKLELHTDDTHVLRAFGNALLEVANAGAPVVTRTAEDTPAAVEDTPAAAAAVVAEPAAATTDAGTTGSIFEQGEATRVDHKGVPFDARYCSAAKEPFYASGKLAGQWKKLRSLDQAAYDQWYAGELAAITSGAPAAGDHPTANAAAAFGAPSQQAQQQATETRPMDAGGLMMYIAEQTAAGQLTPEQADQAFTACGITRAGIFPPTDPGVAQANVNAVYAYLTGAGGN